MKVLLIFDSLSFGGAENLFVTLARAAPGSGFSFELVSVAPMINESKKLLPLLEKAGVRVSFLSIPRLLYPPALPRVVRAIRSSDCDVVHAHLEAATTLGPLAAAASGRPAVCTLHHVPGPLQGRDALRERLSVRVASGSDQMIFVSEAARSAFAQKYGQRPNWTVVHNGVDLEEFNSAPADLPADLDIPSGAPVVAFVAAMRPPKGHAISVRAWPEVVTRIPEAHLLLIGSGIEEERLRAQVAALGLERNVTFAGMRYDVARLLSASALSILPSYSEALPTALIEAAACGKAVIASAVGGVSEIVVDGRTGLLVPPDEPVPLAHAVIDLLLDEPRRRAMGRRARQVAEERFDMHLWASRLRSLYDRAVGGTGRAD